MEWRVITNPGLRSHRSPRPISLLVPRLHLPKVLEGARAFGMRDLGTRLAPTLGTVGDAHGKRMPR